MIYGDRYFREMKLRWYGSQQVAFGQVDRQ